VSKGKSMVAVGEQPVSRLLLEIEAMARQAGGDRVSMEEVLRGAGPRLYGLALVVFALPEAIPFPAVGLTGLIAIPVAAIALTMLIRGMTGGLPGWILGLRLPRRWVVKAAGGGARLVRRLERWTYPRRSHWAEMGRPLGLLCLLLSMVMFIPVPYSNVAPGVTIVAIGVGIFQRDGLLVLAAAAAGVLILSVVAVLLVLGGRLLF